MERKPKVIFNARIDADDLKLVDAKATEMDLTRSKLIARIITEWCRKGCKLKR